jgi:hypothetical protein
VPLDAVQNGGLHRAVPSRLESRLFGRDF